MLNQIDRLVKLRSYARLIERLLPMADCRSAQAAEALQAPGCAAQAAIGLALRRCCELSWRPSPLGRRLAGLLAGFQRPDGLFGADAAPSIGASALALRALSDWRTLCEHAGAATERLNESIRCGIEAMRKVQGGDGLLGEDAIGSAIALAALGDQNAFRCSVDVANLAAAVSRSGAISADLNRYALARAA